MNHSKLSQSCIDVRDATLQRAIMKNAPFPVLQSCTREILSQERTRFAIIEVDPSFVFQEWIKLVSTSQIKASKFVFIGENLLKEQLTLLRRKFPSQDFLVISQSGK